MNATMRADGQRKFKMYAKNVANYKLKGQFFDAYHLDQFVNDEQVNIEFIYFRTVYLTGIDSSIQKTSKATMTILPLIRWTIEIGTSI